MGSFYKRNNLTPIINASGFMTKIGASITNKASINAAKEIMPNFVNIDELQSLASKQISKFIGCEAVVITASASGGLTESVASFMTGSNIDRILQLPNTKGMKNRVLIQQGHLTNYGAEVGQGIRLSGSIIQSCGTINTCNEKNLIDTIKKFSKKISCAMYVISHHCSDYKSVDLKKFILVCKKFKIPTIIDAASEEYMEKIFDLNPDICIFSAHKFMGSLTAGIIAGKKKYVKNIYKQNLGIGRGMKVGKEGIFASIKAVENWYSRNIVKELNNQKKIINYWINFLNKKKYKGINYEIIPDPTGNKIFRLRILVDKKLSSFTVFSLVYHLEKNNPAIFVRDDLIHLNHFELDTCNLKKGDKEIIVKEMNKIILKLLSNKIRKNIDLKLYKKLSLNNWENWLN